ncbi:MAG: homoserine dehydrogenase [bacterium]
MKEIGIGLLGFGTVGAGVVEALQKNGDLLADRTGVRLVLRKIADVDLERDRGIVVDRTLLTTDAMAVINDPAVQIVVELIGGTKIARTLITHALEQRKPVVTANKALLAECGSGLFRLAANRGVTVGFEASVAGAIPIIRALREGLVVNRIARVYGILNGTCNYILTRMDREGDTFDHALKEAQAHGYAESDPTLDVDGWDTAHKAVILASLAYGFPIEMSSVHVEGIRTLSKIDIDYSRVLGYRVKLLGVVKAEPDGIEVRVHPTLIPVDHMLSSVNGVFNAVMVDGDIAGQSVYFGRGAGRLPTASAVLSDLADIAGAMAAGAPFPPTLPRDIPGRCRNICDISSRYYLRVSLLDKPGVMGALTTVLGNHGISIASVVQKETHAGRNVPVIIVTHRAREADMNLALSEIDARPFVGAKTIRLRIEDLDGQ